MFKILHKAASVGVATVEYPTAAPIVSEHFRGRPEFDFAAWVDARPAADRCPTGAIAVHDDGDTRDVTVDLGLCTFCGECAGPAVRMTRDFELATRDRNALMAHATYELKPDGTHARLVSSADALGEQLRETIDRTLGRALAIRQVDAGSCNGCEAEIVALNNPIHDLERFGIHFVASPRHADMLLVTGPVTRNMELALEKTYNATPDPKIVVAVGACGISGGIFGTNYASRGGVGAVIPVDVYIPGCPPRPEALLYGILLAVGRITRPGSPCPSSRS
jgi:Ni,Fe-hydrogenase III small subunit/formate hydrogenlyase subunit 6/NADH:ubiquinone oxidoreductase subunit I